MPGGLEASFALASLLLVGLVAELVDETDGEEGQEEGQGGQPAHHQVVAVLVERLSVHVSSNV